MAKKEDSKGKNGKTKGKKKPDPKMLGTGMARKAGEKLKGRKKAIDDKLKKYGA
jgi:hypothetical protein